MRMEGMADDDGYEEEEACGGSKIEEKWGGIRGFQGERDRQELE